MDNEKNNLILKSNKKKFPYHMTSSQEPPSPVVDVQALQDKISKLEVDLEFSEKNLAFQKEHSAKLQTQVCFLVSKFEAL